MTKAQVVLWNVVTEQKPQKRCVTEPDDVRKNNKRLAFAKLWSWMRVNTSFAFKDVRLSSCRAQTKDFFEELSKRQRSLFWNNNNNNRNYFRFKSSLHWNFTYTFVVIFLKNSTILVLITISHKPEMDFSIFQIEFTTIFETSSLNLF